MGQHVGDSKGSSTFAYGLTTREQQVLQLAADGKKNAAIAAELGLAFETVKTHLKKASIRLDAWNRTHAVAIALRAGLIT